MTASGSRGAIVIDTDVFSADLVPTSRLAQRYAPIITLRLGIPLVSNDTIFKAVPDLTLESLA